MRGQRTSQDGREHIYIPAGGGGGGVEKLLGQRGRTGEWHIFRARENTLRDTGENWNTLRATLWNTFSAKGERITFRATAGEPF